jgi:2-oxoisovalerate dehydrogenase E1 component alpha subunit
LASKGWWSETEEAALIKKTKADVMRAFTRAEKLPKPKLSEMFNDVWAVAPGEQVPTIIVSIYCP